MKGIFPREFTIAHGPHVSYGKGACALEWVDYLDRTRRGKEIGEATRLTDAPVCVCPVLRAFVIDWNDAFPDTAEGNAERMRLLGPLLPRLLDTAGDTREIEERRSWMAFDWIIREYTPAWLDAARLTTEADALRALAPVTDFGPLSTSMIALQEVYTKAAAAETAARANARTLRGIPRAADAWAAAWEETEAAVWTAAWAAAWGAAKAAARNAVEAGAGAAAWNAAWTAAWTAAKTAAMTAAMNAARDAARAALAPTVAGLQTSAVRLLERMIEAEDL